MEWLGPLMFVCALALLFAGYPVAFTLAGVSLLFAFIGVEAGFFDWTLMLALPERTFGILSNAVLLSVPSFVFMGTMLEKSGLAQDLLRTIGALFGPRRGGLAFAVVFVGTLLAAATGVVGASVVAMGLISLPAMLRYGYDKRLATGVIAASGTLGQIIPPSVVLVVLADQVGVAVGSLFRAALVPGLLLAGLYAVYIAVLTWMRPEWVPALPPEARTEQGAALAGAVLRALVPPLALVFIVLGSILFGWVTPTEGGAAGAVGALGLAAARGRLDGKRLFAALDETARLTAMVVMLLVGSTAFTLVFRGLYGDLWVEDLLTNLPGGAVGLLVVTNLAVFILGCFIDFFEIAFILLPLLVPAARLLGVDLTWFAIVIAMNLQTSFLTPPFGFSLFYLRGVAPPEVTTGDLYRGIVPFVALQLLALLLVIFFPGLLLQG